MRRRAAAYAPFAVATGSSATTEHGQLLALRLSAFALWQLVVQPPPLTARPTYAFSVRACSCRPGRCPESAGRKVGESGQGRHNGTPAPCSHEDLRGPTPTIARFVTDVPLTGMHAVAAGPQRPRASSRVPTKYRAPARERRRVDEIDDTCNRLLRPSRLRRRPTPLHDRLTPARLGRPGSSPPPPRRRPLPPRRPGSSRRSGRSSPGRPSRCGWRYRDWL
jgi:hypothetical protein